VKFLITRVLKIFVKLQFVIFPIPFGKNIWIIRF
jgi:hypothetical protein